MTMDSKPPLRPPPPRDIWRVPEMLDLQIRRRRFDTPRRVTTEGVDRYVSDAIEFEVRVSEPFVARALGPALWVGDQALTAAEMADEQTYRFFSFEPEKLQAGAPISLGWSTQPEPRQETKFRFTMPAQ